MKNMLLKIDTNISHIEKEKNIQIHLINARNENNIMSIKKQ